MRAWCLAFIFVAGCATDPTAIELRLVASGVTIPTDVATVTVRATGVSSGTSLTTGPLALLSGEANSFILRPGPRDDEDVRVTVEALDPGGAFALRRELLFGFVPEKVVTLEVVLEDACLRTTCGGEEDCLAGMCGERTDPRQGALPDGGAPADAGPDAAEACGEGCGDCAADCASCTCGPGCTCDYPCVGDCTRRCEGSSCEVSGEGSETVSLNCVTAACALRDVADAAVDVRCVDGARCDLDCTGAASCSVRCRGAECLLRCEPSQACEIQPCPGGATDCGGGVSVCARECP